MNSTQPLSLNLRTVIILVVLGIILLGGGFLIAQGTSLVVPVEASAEAGQIDNLLRILLLIGGAIFLLVQVMLAYSVWRFRAKPGDTSEGILLHGSTTLEIVWTAVPAVVVFVLTIISYQVFVSIQSPKEGELRIESVGARFNWAFNYGAPMSIYPEQINVAQLPQNVQDDLADDNSLTISSTELHTYVGRPVELVMEPRDVIHSFWVPAFRIKQDLIPGRVTTVRFTPTLAGTYPIRCAELCGANHGMMIAEVIVHEDEAAYNAWLVPQMERVINPPADPVERGRLILAEGPYPCYTCHVLEIPGANNPWVGTVGPALNGIADRAASTRSTATGLSGADYLYQSIHEPTAYLAPGYGPLMPQLNVPECEIQAMVAYLCTVSDTGEPQCSIDMDAYAATCGGAGAPPAELTAEATADLTSEATAEAGLTSEATTEATLAADDSSTPVDEATEEATP